MISPAEDASLQDGLYPMRVVARLTGLSADTIRAWERRYGAVEPERSDGGTRRFSAEDVRRLTLLREATQAGHAISNIAHLDAAGLEALLAADEEAARPEAAATALSEDAGLAELRERYLSAILRFDVHRARDILQRAAMLLSPRDFVFNVVLPLLEEVGERWSHTELGVAQEHLVSAQVKGLLATLVRLQPPDPGAARVLVTTPEGQRHEFGVMVGGLLAASRGLDVVYLGPDLPEAEIRWAADMSRARVVLIGVLGSMRPAEVQAHARAIAELSRVCAVWVGAPPDHPLVTAAPEARYFHRFEDLDVALADLSR